MARKAAEDGFTLLEVLVALAILAIGFGAAYRALSEDTRRVGSTPADFEATAMAERLLARLGHDVALQSGEQSGVDPSGLAWTVSAAPYGQTLAAAPGAVVAYRVTVEVRWDGLRRERPVRLTSVRLGHGGG